jgi:hypothetical protein
MVNNSARARIIPEQATEPFAAMEGPSGESLYREQKNVVLSLVVSLGGVMVSMFGQCPT